MYWEKILLTLYAIKTLCLTFNVWTKTSTTTAPLQSGHHSQRSVWRARIKSNTLKSFSVKVGISLEAKKFTLQAKSKDKLKAPLSWKGIWCPHFQACLCKDRTAAKSASIAVKFGAENVNSFIKPFNAVRTMVYFLAICCKSL